jgi:hypothetical protein
VAFLPQYFLASSSFAGSHVQTLIRLITAANPSNNNTFTLFILLLRSSLCHHQLHNLTNRNIRHANLAVRTLNLALSIANRTLHRQRARVPWTRLIWVVAVWAVDAVDGAARSARYNPVESHAAKALDENLLFAVAFAAACELRCGTGRAGTDWELEECAFAVARWFMVSRGDL